jgi:hypothetical protein
MSKNPKKNLISEIILSHVDEVDKLSAKYISGDFTIEEFAEGLSDEFKTCFLTLGMMSEGFSWESYINEMTKQIGYMSRFCVAIDTEIVGQDGRIGYRAKLYIYSALWYYYRLERGVARRSGKTQARRICEECENLSTDWTDIRAFVFETGLLGKDCLCHAEFK